MARVDRLKRAACRRYYQIGIEAGRLPKHLRKEIMRKYCISKATMDRILHNHPRTNTKDDVRMDEAIVHEHGQDHDVMEASQGSVERLEKEAQQGECEHCGRRKVAVSAYNKPVTMAPRQGNFKICRRHRAVIRRVVRNHAIRYGGSSVRIRERLTAYYRVHATTIRNILVNKPYDDNLAEDNVYLALYDNAKDGVQITDEEIAELDISEPTLCEIMKGENTNTPQKTKTPNAPPESPYSQLSREDRAVIRRLVHNHNVLHCGRNLGFRKRVAAHYRVYPGTIQNIVHNEPHPDDLDRDRDYLEVYDAARAGGRDKHEGEFAEEMRELDKDNISVSVKAPVSPRVSALFNSCSRTSRRDRAYIRETLKRTKDKEEYKKVYANILCRFRISRKTVQNVIKYKNYQDDPTYDLPLYEDYVKEYGKKAHEIGWNAPTGGMNARYDGPSGGSGTKQPAHKKQKAKKWSARRPNHSVAARITRSSIKLKQASASPRKPLLSQVASVELPRVAEVYPSTSATISALAPLPSISNSTPNIRQPTTTSTAVSETPPVTTAANSVNISSNLGRTEADPDTPQEFAAFLSSINLGHLIVHFNREGFVTADDLAALRSSDVRTQFHILDRFRNSMGTKFTLADMLVLMTEVQK